MQEFVELAHRHRRAADFERHALGLLQHQIGFDAAFFLVAGHERDITGAGLDAATLTRLGERKATYEQEIAPVKRAALARRGVAVDTEVLGAPQVARSEYFRDIAGPVSGRHSLLAYLRRGPCPFGVVMLGRTGKAFSMCELRRMEDSLPALSVARAAFGVPWSSPPLPVPGAKAIGERLGLSRYVVRARVPLPDCELIVRDTGGIREMVARHGRSNLVWSRARLARPSQSGWPYVELFHLAAAEAGARRRALFIGCGGAVGPRQFAEMYPGIAIDVVECQPAVLSLARTWFGLGDIPGVELHIADGLDFVRGAPESHWDIVIVDAFDFQQFAFDDEKADFLRAARRVLRPAGAMAVNLIETLRPRGTLSEFVSAARSTFERVRIAPVIDVDEDLSPNALRNVVVIAVKE